MARIRTIKPAFFQNEEVAALPFQCRLLFIGLWTQADREGRLEDRPLRLKVALFPYDDIDVDQGLNALAAAGLVIRYEVEGQKLIWIPKFLKHQQPHLREAASELPPHGASTVLAPCKPAGSGKGKEGKEDLLGAVGSAPSSTDPSALMEFPTVGASGTVYRLQQAQLDEWQGLFPTIDVLAEARKALAWCHANPGRRKTANGMPRFLVSWFTRATDSGRGRVQPQVAASAVSTSAQIAKQRYGHLSVAK